MKYCLNPLDPGKPENYYSREVIALDVDCAAWLNFRVESIIMYSGKQMFNLPKETLDWIDTVDPKSFKWPGGIGQDARMPFIGLNYSETLRVIDEHGFYVCDEYFIYMNHDAYLYYFVPILIYITKKFTGEQVLDAVSNYFDDLLDTLSDGMHVNRGFGELIKAFREWYNCERSTALRLHSKQIEEKIKESDKLVNGVWKLVSYKSNVA